MIKMKIKKPAPKDLLKKAGLRYSHQRELILTVLLDSPTPLTAMEILNKINSMKLRQNFWLSTIYRTLEYLLDAKLLTRIDFPDSSEAAYIAKTDAQDFHYAICTSCHKILTLRFCPLEDSVRQLSLKGFRTHHHRVEIFGICDECHEKQRLAKIRRLNKVKMQALEKSKQLNKSNTSNEHQ